jgi:hypothetical protein
MIRNKPERAAWLVIWGAFLIFLALCAMVPLGIRYYVLHATTPQTATLEVIGGTVRVREPDVASPLAVTKTILVPEGTTIETDANSRGILTFHDGSTTILFPDTQILLREMRVSTFAWGAEPLTIGIDQTRGRIRVGAAPQILTGGNASSTAHLIRINTQQLSATLAEGSYAIEVTADASQVSARDGTAKVTAQDRTVTIGRSQRTVARRGEPPLPPLPAVQDIIVNGDFQDPLPRGWDPLRNSTTTAGIVLGSAKVIAFDNRQTLHIVRASAGQTSADTGLIQQVNREVSDYRSIRLMADVRLQNQSLSGGGILSSEYPLILRMRYRDVYGSEAEWVHGFYFQNINNNPTNNGELAPQGVWVPYESTNLFEIDPRPFFITSLQVYASGWDYDSYVTGVRLVVE